MGRGAALGVACLLTGCSSKTPPPSPKTKKDPDQAVRSFESGSGSADVFGPMPQHERRWTVYWKSLNVSATGKNISTGQMSGVTGRTYSKSRPELEFSGQAGSGDKQNRILTLKGNVRVTSLLRHETMFADQVVYDAGRKLVTARGNVRFEGRVGTIGTFSELLATSDFSKVGTEDPFSHP